MSTSVLAYIADNYGVTTESHPDPILTMAGQLLLTEEGMQEFLIAYSPLMKALEPAAAGAYLISRLGSLNAAMQYMVTHDELFDLSPELWELQLYRSEKGFIEFRIVLQELKELNGPQCGLRNEWREEHLSRWYAGTIRPIVEAIAVASDMDIHHLWKIVPMRLRFIFGQWKEANTSEEWQARYEEDHLFVTKELKGEVFGQLRNPLYTKVVTVDYPGYPGELDTKIKLKTACCMYYRTEGGYYCYTCPRMKPQEREERKEQLRVQFAESAAAKIVAK
ncbi:(2Fe-2S)-binding protein [Paenibacillus qinlingensis]|uniref:(2Fe-2S)-binding protein n=1 Tax=Paenibacillus qinlingensis TaxID=1837343 RepID=UPI00156473EC|nr:(2Fe-2S)-binding protein [Paenibacillus qinlingensis]NQX59515.1 (2Fe-2S)-binding protein [Paenibacillus qinlingensis]